MNNIPIYEPLFSGNEKKYLMDCIDSSWISSQGEYITKFEESLADFHSLNHAVVTSNCTTALHLSLKALDIGPGDEVLCPNLTFIAPANMVILSGAKLVLVDIHPDTLTIDPDLIVKKITNKTKAIIVVHQFGHAAHMGSILEIAEKFDLRVIEDNAESIGGKYKGKLLGTLGDLSTYSFFGNKIMTTGEGGAVLTNDPNIALKCRELRDHGMNSKKRYQHIHHGFNYRMTNMQAAVGLAQMEKIEFILKQRAKQMNAYYLELNNLEGVTLRKFSSWCEPVHWMMTLCLEDNYDRDEFLSFMSDSGVDCRQMINPVHHAKHFLDQFENESFPVSTEVSKQSVHLPSGLSIDLNQIQKISGLIRKFLNSYS